MIKNDKGQVAIRHWNSNPSPYTMPKFNVSLGWVDEDKLPVILTERVKSCCGNTRLKYRLANETDVLIWETGRAIKES